MKTREEVLKDLQLAASICNDNIYIMKTYRNDELNRADKSKHKEIIRHYSIEIAEQRIILNAITDAIYIIEHKVVK